MYTKIKTHVTQKMAMSFPEYSHNYFLQSWNKKERIGELNDYKKQLLLCMHSNDISKEIMPTDQKLAKYLNHPKMQKAAKRDRNTESAAQRRPSADKIVNNEPRSLFEYDFAVKLTKALANSDDRTIEDHFFSGPIFYILRALHYVSSRIPEGRGRRRFIQFGKQEIDKMIRYIADETNQLYRELDG